MLPKYCSEMNDIETVTNLKLMKLQGRCSTMSMTYVAVIDGMTARSHKGGYTLERFKFNSA